MELSGVSYRYRSARSDAVVNVTTAFGRVPTLILGANGAGKSTLLRLMARQLPPSSGTIAGAERYSLIPQSPVAVRGLTVFEQVAYAGWLKGVARPAAETMAVEAMGTVAISDLADKRTTQLSGGQLARLGIACGLVGNIDMLILDEPSASLDPLARRLVHTTLSDITDQGIGVIATSHTAADLDAPFERVVVMDKGEIIHDGACSGFLTEAHQHPVVHELSAALRPRNL